jgi:DNA-binding transcriptional MerR regulator/methylmalonyl-CoA mutase cobalamin-binding subunit
MRTGLTPHLLRAWERRYGVVSPSRSAGGQRLYSDLDIQRLKLLRRLTERGHSIGRLAGVPLADLQRTAREEDLPTVREARELKEGSEEFTSVALSAVRRLEGGELQAVLEKAAVTLGVPGFLDQVASTALQKIGQGWADGTVSIAQEHLASAVFRRVFGWILEVYEVRNGAPRLVVATPPRHVHELGAMLAADAAAAEGWDVTYLGADLPVADIVASARQVGANAVALSVIYPKVDAGLISDLDQLRGGLDRHAPLLLGGAAAVEDRDRLTSLGALIVGSLPEFRSTLLRYRERA